MKEMKDHRSRRLVKRKSMSNSSFAGALDMYLVFGNCQFDRISHCDQTNVPSDVFFRFSKSFSREARSNANS